MSKDYPEIGHIWDIAELLRGDYKRSDYGKVILPFTVLRRLDSILAPTKAAVLAAAPAALQRGEKIAEIVLNNTAKHIVQKLRFSLSCQVRFALLAGVSRLEA